VHLLEEKTEDLPAADAGHVGEEVGVVLEQVGYERDEQARGRGRRGGQGGAGGCRGSVVASLLLLLLFIFVLEELDLLRVVRGGVVILYSERLADEKEEREKSLQKKKKKREERREKREEKREERRKERMLAECEMSASGIQECHMVP
jgi:predicted metalloprotease